MVDNLVFKNVSEPFFVNHNMEEQPVLRKSLTDINRASATNTVATLIALLDLGVNGAIAVPLVEMATFGDEEKLLPRSMVVVMIVLNCMKLISVPIPLIVLPNAFMVKMFIRNALLLVLLLIMIITAKLHVWLLTEIWNSALLQFNQSVVQFLNVHRTAW